MLLTNSSDVSFNKSKENIWFSFKQIIKSIFIKMSRVLMAATKIQQYTSYTTLTFTYSFSSNCFLLKYFFGKWCVTYELNIYSMLQISIPYRFTSSRSFQLSIFATEIHNLQRPENHLGKRNENSGNSYNWKEEIV